MPERRLNQPREQQANAELGHTDVSAPVKVMLVTVFLTTIFSVPLVQVVAEWRGEVPDNGRAGGLFAPQIFDVFKQAPTLDHFTRYEHELEDRSVVGHWILPRMQRVLMALGVGNDSTLLGQDGWLFFADDVNHLAGRAFLSEDVLLSRARAGDHTQDAVQPDPVKAIVHFKQQLAERDIELVIVPTPLKPQLYPEKLTPRYDPERVPLRNPSYASFHERLSAAGVTVFDPAPLLAQHKREGAIDPVYLRTDTHWTPPAMQAVAASLVEHLKAHGPSLPEPPEPVEYRTREVEHTSRGDIFHMLTLPDGVDAGYPAETVTLRQVLPAIGMDDADEAVGETVAPFEIEARIDEITRPPRPGTVAYRDALVSLFLTDVEAVDGREVDTELLIYTFGMRDNEWTSAARLERGQRVRLWIEPWQQVEGDYGAIQRTDITDHLEALMAREYWGHLQPPDDAEQAPGERYWSPDRDADVLLIGDSFSNIYSGEALGWGRSAGLAEQLSLLLQRPVDTIIIDGGGAVAGRRQLAADIARGRDRLDGKRLVIWQFANRELSQGDWALIDLPKHQQDQDAQAAGTR